MNVLLIFVFFGSFLSLIKDCIDADWEWKPTLWFSILFSASAVIPLVVNVMIFAFSDKPKVKVFMNSLLKCVLLDYNESFLVKRCLRGRGVFCNQSSIELCEHNGGESIILQDVSMGSESMVQIGELLKSMIEKSTKTLYVSNCLINKNLVLKFKHLFGKKVLSLFEEKTEVEINISMENNIFELSFYGSKYKCDLNKEGSKDFLFSILKDNICSDSDRLRIKNIDYQIGIMNLNFSGNKLKIFYKGQVFEEINIDFDDDIETLKLIYCLNFWQNNPEKGVLSRDLSKVRKGTGILHCFTIFEIVDKIVFGADIYTLNLESKKYYVEDNNDLDFMSDVLLQTASKLLGETNSKTLFNIFSLYFNLDEIIHKKLFMSILNLNSQINIHRKVKLPNYKLKKCLVDVNYFLKMVNYGCLGFIDKKVGISKAAVELARVHVKLEPQEQPNVPNLAEISRKNLAPRVIQKYKVALSKNDDAFVRYRAALGYKKEVIKVITKSNDFADLVEKKKEHIVNVGKSYKDVLLTKKVHNIKEDFLKQVNCSRIKLFDEKIFSLKNNSESCINGKIEKLNYHSMKRHNKQISKKKAENVIRGYFKRVSNADLACNNIFTLAKTNLLKMDKAINKGEDFKKKNYFELLRNLDKETKQVYYNEVKSYKNFLDSKTLLVEKQKMEEIKAAEKEVEIQKLKREKEKQVLYYKQLELEKKELERKKIEDEKNLIEEKRKSREMKTAFSRIKLGVYPKIFDRITNDKFGRSIKSLKSRLTERAKANNKAEMITILQYFIRAKTEDEYKIYIPEVKNLLKDIENNR